MNKGLKTYQKKAAVKNKKVYILLGGNMGNVKAIFLKACAKIEKQLGVIDRKSSLYRTAAWGNENQPAFLNQVIILHTSETAANCLQALLSIEMELGRQRTVKNAPRTIDIDILFYEKEVFNEKDLTIPHPQLQNRNFVLAPLRELSPNLLHPIYKINMKQLHLHTSDMLAVEKLSSKKA